MYKLYTKICLGNTKYPNEFNYSISKYSNTPPFQGNVINHCIPSIRTSMFKIIKYYSNIQTPTPCEARIGVSERLIAFDGLCRATARVTEHLAYYMHFWMSNRLLTAVPYIYRVAKRVLAFDNLCGALIGCVRTLNSLRQLWTGLVIVTINVDSVFVWSVLLSIYYTEDLIFEQFC